MDFLSQGKRGCQGNSVAPCGSNLLCSWSVLMQSSSPPGSPWIPLWPGCLSLLHVELPAAFQGWTWLWACLGTPFLKCLCPCSPLSASFPFSPPCTSAPGFKAPNLVWIPMVLSVLVEGHSLPGPGDCAPLLAPPRASVFWVHHKQKFFSFSPRLVKHYMAFLRPHAVHRTEHHL